MDKKNVKEQVVSSKSYSEKPTTHYPLPTNYYLNVLTFLRSAIDSLAKRSPVRNADLLHPS